MPSPRAERLVGAEEPEDVKLDALELKLLVVEVVVVLVVVLVVVSLTAGNWKKSLK